MMAAGASLPCTGTGRISTSTIGKRRASTCSTSRTAAPLADVMTPMRRGRRGSGRLRSLANRPSAANCFFSRSNSRCRAPSPASSRCSTMSWNSPRASYRLTRARASTCRPSVGLNPSQLLRGLNIAQRTWAVASLRVKYRCPEAGRETLESSPSIHTEGSASSSRSCARRFRADGVSTVRLAGFSSLDSRFMTGGAWPFRDNLPWMSGRQVCLQCAGAASQSGQTGLQRGLNPRSDRPACLLAACACAPRRSGPAGCSRTRMTTRPGARR